MALGEGTGIPVRVKYSRKTIPAARRAQTRACPSFFFARAASARAISASKPVRQSVMRGIIMQQTLGGIR